MASITRPGRHGRSENLHGTRSRQSTTLNSNDREGLRSTQGFCRACRGIIGDFYNSWFRIDDDYALPTLAGSHRSLLKGTGRRQMAPTGSVLDGW